MTRPPHPPFGSSVVENSLRAERDAAYPGVSTTLDKRSRLRSNQTDRGLAKLAVLPLIVLARLWQLGPSRVLPPACRYAPSCSAYAIEAWTRYGALKGSWLAARRLARCHPWGGCGVDLVP